MEKLLQPLSWLNYRSQTLGIILYAGILSAIISNSSLQIAHAATSTWNDASTWGMWTTYGHTSTTQQAGKLALSSVPTSVVADSATLPQAAIYGAAAFNPTTGNAYIFGGFDGNFRKLNSIYLFNPANDTVGTSAALLPQGLAYDSATFNPTTGKAYVFGGQASNGSLNTIYIYNPSIDGLSASTAVLPQALYDTSSVTSTITNKSYIIGGQGSTAENTAIYIYNPNTDTVSTSAAVLPEGLESSSAVFSPDNGKIYIFGGYSYFAPRGPSAAIYIYDPSTDTLSTSTAVLPVPIQTASAIFDSDNNLAYIFGGFGATAPSYYNTISIYNPASDTLSTSTTVLPRPIVAGSAGFSPAANTAYIFGGEDGSGSSSSIYDFTPGGYSTSGSAHTLVDGSVASSWSSLTRSQTVASGQGISYYAVAQSDTNSCSSSVETMGNLLSFSSDVASLSSFSPSRYLCLDVKLTGDGTATPLVNSLSVAYAATPTPTPSATPHHPPPPLPAAQHHQQPSPLR